MFILDPHSTDLRFPPLELASPEGLLAVGGDLRAERLLEAYRHGIFPWYNEGQPILWWSPDPRAVLLPEHLRIGRSLRKRLRRGDFAVTLDAAFAEVMTGCAAPRGRLRAAVPDHRANARLGGTWITPEMLEAYARLHALGHAHSVEAWQDGRLAGGLYGVALGGVFFGESMFTRTPDASKVAFVHLVRQLERWGFRLIDCQQYTAHLARFGAAEIRRTEFLDRLEAALALPGRAGPWRLDPDLVVG
jgi:leucyl/phenylalanyl-tRNA--protein transferase